MFGQQPLHSCSLHPGNIWLQFDPRKLLFVNVRLAESHPEDITHASVNSTQHVSVLITSVCSFVLRLKGAKVWWHGPLA